MSNKRFELETFGTVYEKCFLYLSRYLNGNLQISVFGMNTRTNLTEHFWDITVEQNSVELQENHIVVDNYLKEELVQQLKQIGILKQYIGTYIIQGIRYPIYELDMEIVKQHTYETEEISA